MKQDVMSFKGLKEHFLRYRFQIFCLVFIAISFLFCVRVSGRQSFAADEMSEIGFIARANSLKDILMYFLTIEVTNLPLFALIAAAWYRIVPWGESWLLLLCEIFTSAGIFFLCLSARKLKDEAAGYLTAVFCTISSTLILRCDMEYRCYSFLFLMIAVFVYLYVKRMNSEPAGGIKNEIVLGVAMTFLAYSHYFGPLIIVAFFVTDLFLFIKKRLKAVFVIPYLMSGLLLTPWFLLMLKFKEKSITDFWPAPPTFGSIPEMLRFVLSHDEPIYFLSVTAMTAVAVLAVFHIIYGNFKWEFDYPLLAFLWVIWFLLLGVYLYSAHINIYGSIWVDKYFISILPFLALIMSVFVSMVLDFVTEKHMDSVRLKAMSVTVISLVLFLYFGLGNYYHDVKEYLSKPLDPYREAALYLKDNRAESGEAVPLLLPAEVPNALGFQEYYIDHFGLQDDIRVVSWVDPDAEEIIGGSDMFYVFDIRDRINDQDGDFKKLLNDRIAVDRTEKYKLTLYKK